MATPKTAVKTAAPRAIPANPQRGTAPVGLPLNKVLSQANAAMRFYQQALNGK